MGIAIQARCECGFKFDNIFTGSGMRETPSWWAPAICLNCRKLLVMDYKEKYAICPVCHKEVTFYNNPLLQVARYLFNWDKVPGYDSGRFMTFLDHNFGIRWTDNAKIEKIDYGKTIRLSFGKRTISVLRLNYDKTRINLELHAYGEVMENYGTLEVILKIEDGNLNIYAASDDQVPLILSDRTIAELSDFRLPDTQYICPGCGKMTMRFYFSGLWD